MQRAEEDCFDYDPQHGQVFGRECGNAMPNLVIFLSGKRVAWEAMLFCQLANSASLVAALPTSSFWFSCHSHFRYG